MTEEQYQKSYANGTMDPKTRIEYERYLAWKNFNQMVTELPIDAPATENMTFYEQLPVFPIDDTTKTVSKTRSIFPDITVNNDFNKSIKKLSDELIIKIDKKLK